MNTLFCTPEQGKRLKELLPELTSAYWWAVIDHHVPNHISSFNGRPTSDMPPALTLQELRDVAIEIPSTFMLDLANKLTFYTAPELAEWVIARLEEGR
jgi:hypothetical protein